MLVVDDSDADWLSKIGCHDSFHAIPTKHPRKETDSPRLTGDAGPLLDRSVGIKSYSRSHHSRHARRHALRSIACLRRPMLLVVSPAERVKLEACAFPSRGIEEIARVDDDATAHRLRDVRRIDLAERVVIDDKHERIGAVER